MGIRTSVHQIPQFRDNFHLHVLVLGIFHKYFRVNKSKAKLKSSTIFLLIVIYSPCRYLSSSNNAPRLNGWLIFLPHFQHSVDQDHVCSSSIDIYSLLPIYTSTFQCKQTLTLVWCIQQPTFQPPHLPLTRSNPVILSWVSFVIEGTFVCHFIGHNYSQLVGRALLASSRYKSGILLIIL